MTMPKEQEPDPAVDQYEQRVQAMFFRWGALGCIALILGFIIEGIVLTTQVQGLEPRMRVLEAQMERNSHLFDRLDSKVDEIRNEVTRLSAISDEQ